MASLRAFGSDSQRDYFPSRFLFSDVTASFTSAGWREEARAIEKEREILREKGSEIGSEKNLEYYRGSHQLRITRGNFKRQLLKTRLEERLELSRRKEPSGRRVWKIVFFFFLSKRLLRDGGLRYKTRRFVRKTAESDDVGWIFVDFLTALLLLFSCRCRD